MNLSHAAARYLIAATSLATCVSVQAGQAGQAGFDGSSFSTYYGFPSVDTVYGDYTVDRSSFRVGAGIETVFNVEGLTDISVDFSDTRLSLVLNTTLPNPSWNPSSFNGLVFDLLCGTSLAFTGWNIDKLTTMSGFSEGRVGLTGNRLTIDWNGLSYVDGTKVVVNFASQAPEPGTYAMMALGLALIGCATRRRRNETAV